MRVASEELSKREIDVLRCAAEGLNREETARELFIEVGTIAHHRTNIFRKLDAKTLGHAIALAYERKLFELNLPEEVIFGGLRYALVKEVA